CAACVLRAAVLGGSPPRPGGGDSVEKKLPVMEEKVDHDGHVAEARAQEKEKLDAGFVSFKTPDAASRTWRLEHEGIGYWDQNKKHRENEPGDQVKNGRLPSSRAKIIGSADGHSQKAVSRDDRKI